MSDLPPPPIGESVPSQDAPPPHAYPPERSEPPAADGPGGLASAPEQAHGTAARGLLEWVVILGVALVGAFLIRTFLIQAFFIPSDSMVPTLQRHDRVLVNKVSYDLHPVHRGDIVVFTHSPGFDPNIKDLIKRVVALPGETVSGQNGHVYINGHQLNEPYLPPTTVTSDFPPRLIPPHDYWVMGDNRTNSADSRVFGPISRQQVVGRAFVLVWPLGRIGLL